MSIPLDMGDIDLTNKHYKAIINTSFVIVTIVVETILLLYQNGIIDLIDLPFIDPSNESSVPRALGQIVTQVIGLTLLDIVVFHTVKYLYCRHWISENRKSWVKGTWLHIHVKDTLRIGKVEIDQDFNVITAKGHNVNPLGTRDRRTTWHYELGRIEVDASDLDYLACYEARDDTRGTVKHGLHSLEIMNWNSEGYAEEMIGYFRDVLRTENGEVISPRENTGQLRLYRPSPRLLQYLYEEGRFSYTRLRGLPSVEEFADEPYVRVLRTCMEDHRTGRPEGQQTRTTAN